VDAERQRAAELDSFLHLGKRTQFHQALRVVWVANARKRAGSPARMLAGTAR
jgi:hypothetical protein